MSSLITPRMTAPAATVRSTVDDLPAVVARPAALGAVKRAAIRLQAAHVTSGMLRERVAIPLAAPRTPLFVRLDALRERYARLGGDPADLIR